MSILKNQFPRLNNAKWILQTYNFYGISQAFITTKAASENLPKNVIRRADEIHWVFNNV
jgi:hypothetical protein